MSDNALRRTPLYEEHVRLGARIVPFAGYEMPVQYPTGIIAEHNWTRTEAGLFDVSHMGQARLTGPDDVSVARALEKLVPGDIQGLAPGRIRYTQLTTPTGGIIDDLMVTRPLQGEGVLTLVVNASRKAMDYEWIETHLPDDVVLTRLPDLALLALQGPKAEAVLKRHAPDAASLPFMASLATTFDGLPVIISRSGYTGEDGFEISMAAKDCVAVFKALLAEPEVKPIGLGARDSLRLEAGLCLYGHDIDEKTTPIEAGLLWSIGKRRRADDGFVGADRILRQISEGPSRQRVGIKPEGKAPARDGTVVTDLKGRQIGVITSGGFGPTLGAPVAMGYVEQDSAAPGTDVQLIVRDKPMPAQIVKLPFVPNNFKR